MCDISQRPSLEVLCALSWQFFSKPFSSRKLHQTNSNDRDQTNKSVQVQMASASIKVCKT